MTATRIPPPSQAHIPSWLEPFWRLAAFDALDRGAPPDRLPDRD
jgi:hypothetical protein